MNPWATVISTYSLEANEVGKPVGEPEATEYPTGMDALLALDRAIDGMPRKKGLGYMLSIRTPDGRLVAFDKAYELVTGKEPVRHTNGKTLYPMLQRRF